MEAGTEVFELDYITGAQVGCGISSVAELLDELDSSARHPTIVRKGEQVARE